MKKLRWLFMVVLVLIFAYGIWAQVQTKTEYRKEFKFFIKPGQRIIVVDENTRQVRVYPPESRKFDYKVPEGKALIGIIKEK